MKFIFTLFCLLGFASIGSAEEFDSARVWSEIHSGWPKSYAPLRSLLHPQSSYLLLHLDMPSTTYDLRDGDKWRQSIYDHGILNLSSYDISHFALGWRCNTASGMEEGLTGMSGEKNRQMIGLAESGWGLATFLSVSTDGYLQNPDQVEERLSRNSGTLHTLVVEVSARQCEEVRGFVNGFLRHPNEPVKNFGLSVDPMKYEGGGCTSFGLAALAHTDFFPDVQKLFFRSATMPEGLFGYGLDHSSDTKPFTISRTGTRSVSIAKLLVNSWKATSGPMAHMADPELLHLFFREVSRYFLSDLYEFSDSFGRTYVRSRETQYRVVQNLGVRVDEKFDAKAREARIQSLRWAKTLKNSGYHGAGLMMNGHPVVILTK